MCTVQSCQVGLFSVKLNDWWDGQKKKLEHKLFISHDFKNLARSLSIKISHLIISSFLKSPVQNRKEHFSANWTASIYWIKCVLSSNMAMQFNPATSVSCNNSRRHNQSYRDQYKNLNMDVFSKQYIQAKAATCNFFEDNNNIAIWRQV